MKPSPLPLLPLCLAASLCADPARGQVPDGHLVVSTFNYPTNPGTAGLYFVDPATGAATPVSGLPCELLATCSGSNGAQCVVRDPRTERLLVGNGVNNSGSIGAWLLTLQGSTVVSSVSCTVGTVPAFDMGVNAAAFLPGGDVLLAAGRIVSGANAFSPVLLWTPPASGSGGTLTPVALPAVYMTTGNLCNALVVNEAGDTAFAICKNNALFGAGMVFDLLVIPLNGGAVTVVPSGLATGEFVTQLFWDCNGDLLGGAAQFPLTFGGRVMRWTAQGGSWSLAGSQSWPGMLDSNAGVSDPATCERYVNFNVQGVASNIHRWDAAGTMTLLTSGPAQPWGVVSGIDVNPNPEVSEHPSGASQIARWAYRPFPGGTPTVGNLTFTLPLITGPAASGIAVAFADFARTAGVAVLGLDAYLPATAVPLAALVLPDPSWALPLPNQPSLVGVEVFAQAVVLDGSGLGASDLLQFTIR